MSQFLNDSLSKQIERGEIFFTGQDYAVSNFNTDDNSQIIITTGANECQVNISIEAGCPITFSLYEGSTHTGGSSITQYNMRRSVAGSLSTVVKTFPATVSIAGATLLAIRYSENGTGLQLTPFNYESGIILNASTEYYYSIANSGPINSSLSVSLFLREL